MLELIWPKVRSRFDSIVVAEMAGGVCVVYGVISLILLTLYGRAATGTILSAFFFLAGFEIAVRRRQALLLVHAFLWIAACFCIVAFGPSFVSYCLVGAAVPLFGAWRTLGSNAPLVGAKAFIQRLRSVTLAFAAVAAITAVALGTVLFSSFTRSSDLSMLPAISPNDHVVGIGRPFAGSIARGELWETSGYGTGRVIGLPGDDIQIRIGELILNGVPINEPYARVYTDWHGDFPLPAEGYDEYYRFRHESAFGSRMTSETVYRVPAGRYFMLNDNRKEVSDSRLIGPFSKDQLVGWLIIAFHTDRGFPVQARIFH